MTMAGKDAYAMWGWYQMSQIEVKEQAMGKGDRLQKFHGRCHLATTQGGGTTLKLGPDVPGYEAAKKVARTQQYAWAGGHSEQQSDQWTRKRDWQGGY